MVVAADTLAYRVFLPTKARRRWLCKDAWQKTDNAAVDDASGEAADNTNGSMGATGADTTGSLSTGVDATTAVGDSGSTAGSSSSGPGETTDDAGSTGESMTGTFDAGESTTGATPCSSSAG
ncbi:MAG: hypothetical protein JKY37_16220 [Nannocystaceae bacterium]|nr:hypothetical protein [Nannocystaceae bacterium]